MSAHDEVRDGEFVFDLNQETSLSTVQPRQLAASPQETASKEIIRRVTAAAGVLPRYKAERHRAIVLDRTGSRSFRLAMVNPGDVDACEDIARALKTTTQHIQIDRVDEDTYLQYFRLAYLEGTTREDHDAIQAARTSVVWGEGDKQGAAKANENAVKAEAATSNFNLQDLTDTAEYNRNINRQPWEMPTRDFVRLILMEFIRAQASDLHVEAGSTGGRIRFRADGVPFPRFENIPMQKAKQVVSSLTSMGSLPPAELKFRPLNTTIRLRVLKNGQPEETELRFSSIPASPLPEIVLRSQDNIIDKLELIGLLQPQLDVIHQAIAQPQGIVVITGPTGSGKTNTLAGVFTHLEEPDDKKIIEMADPIEIYSNRRSQMQITKTASWMDCFHACLRQDPDVIALGELRGLDTVNVALDAALTGHLVLATYHTVNIETTFTRFLKMGVTRDLLADGLNAIVSQRLVRVLCRECKEVDEENTQALLKPEAIAQGRKIYKPKGCSFCYGQGFKGRTALAEVLLIRDEIKYMIAAGKDGREIVERAVENGWMLSMQQVASHKIQSGETTLKEVERVMKLTVETPSASHADYSHAADTSASASSSGVRRPAASTASAEEEGEQDFVDAEEIFDEEAA